MACSPIYSKADGNVNRPIFVTENLIKERNPRSLTKTTAKPPMLSGGCGPQARWRRLMSAASQVGAHRPVSPESRQERDKQATVSNRHLGITFGKHPDAALRRVQAIPPGASRDRARRTGWLR